jgi:hypothetical protein
MGEGAECAFPPSWSPIHLSEEAKKTPGKKKILLKINGATAELGCSVPVAGLSVCYLTPL